HPVLSGEKALFNSFPAQGQRVFTGAAKKLKVGEGDVLFAYVFIDPLAPPKEIMLQWHASLPKREANIEWAYRRYWGENPIESGKPDTPERPAMGDLPPSGKWVRLEVPAAKLGLKPGSLIDGWAFTQHGGNVYWDKAGIEPFTPQDGQTFDTLTAW